MKLTNFRVAMIASVLVTASMVHAADEKNNAFRIGIYLPTSTATKNATADSWISFGLDHFLDKPVGKKSTMQQSVGVDYFEKNGTRSIPLVLNFHVPGQSGLSYFYGAGIADTHAANESDNFTYVLNVGANFELGQGKAPLFLQAKYIFTGKEDFRGFNVSLGIKF